MSSFTIRTAEGFMVSRITGIVAENILRHFEGKWRNYKEEGDTEYTRCLDITEDSAITIGDKRDGLRMFFWKGYKIILDLPH